MSKCGYFCMCFRMFYYYYYLKGSCVIFSSWHITPCSLKKPSLQLSTALTQSNFASGSRGTTRHSQWTKVTLRKTKWQMHRVSGSMHETEHSRITRNSNHRLLFCSFAHLGITEWLTGASVLAVLPQAPSEPHVNDNGMMATLYNKGANHIHE